MDARSILARKRDGEELAAEEIEFLISNYVAGEVPDYQMAAFLMAVYLNGMTPDETFTLTSSMIASGKRAHFDGLDRPAVDKHSTGGVGDKISLILAPLAAVCGAAVPMMSGRSLEHSGGTLDKLESIPGYRTDLSLQEFEQQVREIGVAITGQTAEMVPADKKLYALRDATATVASVPLVTGSILSKKTAEGIEALVLDVKVGSGAFFKDLEGGRRLAQSLLSVAQKLGLQAVALLTDMNQPLGRTVGNWVEVEESAEVLQGGGPEEVVEITLELTARMLTLTGLVDNLAAAKRLAETKLRDGSAWLKFLEMVEKQGGDTSVLENPQRYPKPKYTTRVKAERSGFVQRVDALDVGVAALELGAGRKRVEDTVDPLAGVRLLKETGDEVRAGETVALLQTSAHGESLEVARARVLRAFEIGDEPPELRRLILDELA
ncbi:MAG TPA: thymidine phosphorylase [Bacteroidetes bacterium]|nr:thymidine phosphorylase [Bacteroidota bacterium]